MKTALLPTLATILLFGGAAIHSHADAPQFHVGTYNIRTSNGDRATTNAWACRKGYLAALVRKLDLDVVGIQEVKPGQLAFLRNELPQHAALGFFSNEATKRTESTPNPVFFRKERFDLVRDGVFWLSETPDVPLSKSWATSEPRACTWVVLKDKASGATLCFANVHTDHLSPLAREKGMGLVLDRLAEIAPQGAAVVLVGDHNCRENTRPAKLAAARMRDALYATQTPPKGPWRTFTAWRWLEHETPATEALKVDSAIRNATKKSPEGERLEDGIPVFKKYGARIDYIYVSEGVKVLEYESHADKRPDGNYYPSDHFPVTAVIEL